MYETCISLQNIQSLYTVILLPEILQSKTLYKSERFLGICHAGQYSLSIGVLWICPHGLLKRAFSYKEL